MSNTTTNYGEMISELQNDVRALIGDAELDAEQQEAILRSVREALGLSEPADEVLAASADDDDEASSEEENAEESDEEFDNEVENEAWANLSHGDLENLEDFYADDDDDITGLDIG